MKLTRRQDEKGAALAIGLIFLLLASIVAVSAMRGSNLQEKMTSNTNHKARSLMMAEMAASDLAKRASSDGFWENTESSSLSFSEITEEFNSIVSRNNTNDLGASVEPVYWDDENDFLVAVIVGESLVDNKKAGETRIRLGISEPSISIKGPCGGGICAQGKITWSGKTEIEGTMHSNVGIEGNHLTIRGDDSKISARGEIEIGGDIVIEGSLTEAQAVIPNSELVTVPSAREFIACYVDATQENGGAVDGTEISNIYKDWVNSGEAPSDGSGDPFKDYCLYYHGFFVQQLGRPLDDDDFTEENKDEIFPFRQDDVVVMEVDGDGVPDAPGIECQSRTQGGGGGGGNDDVKDVDLGGKVFFCDANLRVDDSTNIKDGVLMATGNLRLNGSSVLGDDGDVTVGFYVGGDIEFNGKRDAFGLFWADGNLTQSGGSTIEGSVVVGGGVDIEEITDGDADFRGGVVFKQRELTGNLPRPTRQEITPARIAQWREIL